jgi:hypothetical protein
MPGLPKEMLAHYVAQLDHRTLGNNEQRRARHITGCSCRANLTSHHCIFRSRNGPDTEENETGASPGHHFHGLHKGTIEVKGKAPDGLIWRLGVRKDGTALLTIGPGEQLLEEDGVKRQPQTPFT